MDNENLASAYDRVKQLVSENYDSEASEAEAGVKYVSSIKDLIPIQNGRQTGISFVEHPNMEVIINVQYQGKRYAYMIPNAQQIKYQEFTI